MNNYIFKNFTVIGREYMVEKFNIVFNMNIIYGFFKNKFDEFKKSYKRWKFFTYKIGIIVDSEILMIFVFDVW